jgi:hypothetical protein
MKAGVLVSLLVVPFLSLLSSCGLSQSGASESQWFLAQNPPERIRYSLSADGRAIPEVVGKFLHSADAFGRGVRQYRLGSYQKSVTDCSGFIGQAHRQAGHAAFVYQFDRDPFNFTQCHGGLKPGDVVLLAYAGRQPDHWILMGDVVAGRFHSSKNIILDVSSDSVGGVPYFKGELGRRRNLMARQVYACRRHRSFDKAWRQLEVQLREDAKKAAEQKEGTSETEPVTPDADSNPTTDPHTEPLPDPNSDPESGDSADSSDIATSGSLTGASAFILGR